MRPSPSCQPLLNAQLPKASCCMTAELKSMTGGRTRSYRPVHVCVALVLGYFASFAPYLSAGLQGQGTQCSTLTTSRLPATGVSRKGLPALEAHRVPSLKQLWEYEPVLLPDALRRGGASQTGNEHLTAFVDKLLTGQAVSVLTLGGSVTYGGGASSLSLAYPHHLFRWINVTFPPAPGQPAHRFKNNGLPGTSSALFAICTEDLVPSDADLIVLEFAVNDEWREQDITGDSARAFEQLLRKLRSMPRRPAVVLLAYWSWFYGQDFGRGGPVGPVGQFFKSAETNQLVFAQYYDLPLLSVRSAIYPYMLEGRKGFKVDYAGTRGSPWAQLEPVPPGEDPTERFYTDGMHPADPGHRCLADLVIGLVRSTAAAAMGQRQPAAAPNVTSTVLPPMIPGNLDAPPSVCLQQDAFKAVMAGTSNFTYAADRPAEPTVAMQKWGWTGSAESAWINLKFSSRIAGDANATVHLGYLRSYEGMGAAKVSCLSGCACEASEVEGHWEQRSSLTQIHAFEVTPHKACKVRVRILGRTLSGGHKFSLRALIISSGRPSGVSSSLQDLR